MEIQKAPLLFSDPEIEKKIRNKVQKLRKDPSLFIEVDWLSAFFKEEMTKEEIPPIAIRYIDETVGFGVFATKKMYQMQFVGEYTGMVRKKRREDQKNSYCFEFIFAPDHKSPYTIDGRDHGNWTRYINHNDIPNLTSKLALFDGIPRVILYTKRGILPGEQLVYDYGKGYWAKRDKPVTITS